VGHQDYTYYGRVAYEAHRESRGWTDETGAPIPEWEEIGADAQQSWITVGHAVVEAYTGETG
jgi:hypothetical protein